MSSEYRIFETDEFTRKLSKLNPKDRAFIQNKLSVYVYPQIKQSPWFGRNIKKLKGYDPATWRYRIGKFRLFYIVNDETRTVFLLTVDHRKDAYS